MARDKFKQKKQTCKLVIVCDTAGKLITANKHAEEHFQLTKSHYQKHISSFLSLSSVNINKLISNPESLESIWSNTPLSKELFLEISKDLAGNVTFLFCFHQNEERRRDLNRRIQIDKLMDDIGVGLWHFDNQANACFFSPQLRSILQVEGQSFTWQEFQRLVYIEDRGVFDIFFKNYFEHQIPLDFEFRVLVNGEIKWLRLKGDKLHDQPHETSVIAGTIMDCSKEKETLTALNNAIETRNISMKAGNIGSWRAAKQDNGRWQWDWDELANEMFKLDKKDIGDLEKWAGRLHPDDIDFVLKSVERSLETGEFFDVKYRAVMPNGDLKYFKGQGQVGTNFRGDICRIDGICIDQTTIVNTQEQLKLLNSDLENRVSIRTKELKREKERAELASRTKSEFLSMMSHELRTPMNAVIGSLDLLALTSQTHENKELIDTASVSANNLISILNDILDISKIESGKLEIEENEFSIYELISNINKIFIPIAESKNIHISVIEDENIPRFVRGDQVRVRQILFNLIGNAIKFTHSKNDSQGKVSLTASVHMNTEHIVYVNFAVKDNVIGISKDVQKKLFMPFVQAEKSTTRQYGGTGLGLAICAKLTEMMGGSLLLDSDLGKGSTFTIEMPFYHAKSTEQQSSISGTNVIVFDAFPTCPVEMDRLSGHLKSEGALVSLKTINELQTFEDQQDCLSIVLIDEAATKNEDLLFHLLFEVDDQRSLIVTKKYNLDFAKQKLPGMRILAIEEITRFSMVETISALLSSSKNIETPAIETTDVSGLSSDLVVEGTRRNRVLVVEDNEFNQTLIQKQLSNLGYACDLAENGKKGIEMWHEHDYRLILTDCHMPEMDGYEMSKQLRNIEKKLGKTPIPVIAVTGAAMKGDDDKCYQSGMNDFVSKPVKLDNLKTVMEKWY